MSSFLSDVGALPRDLKLLGASLFVWASGEALFIYIAPLYLEQLGASPVDIGNILSLAALVSACSMIPAGVLTDRWGAKPVLLLGWGVGLAAGLIMALAAALTWFAVGWILYAVTMFVIPAVSSYAVAGRGRLPPERALTMTSAGYALGNVLSPALGGWIASLFGLRSLFWVATALFTFSTAVMFLVRAQPPQAQPGERNFRALLGNRQFVGFCTLVLGVWVVLWLGLPLAPNFLADVRGLSVAQVAVLGSFNALGWAGLNLVLGRRPPRRAFMIAQVLVMVYLAILLRANWYGWIAVAYVARAAHYTAHSLVNAQATRIVERARWGLAFGVLETVAWLGAFVAPLIAGRLYAIDPARPFQLALLLLPAALLATYLFAPRAGHAPEPAPAVLPAAVPLASGEGAPPTGSD